MGNVLGKRSARWQQRLATIPDCEILTEVPIRDHLGRIAGDLDVVAWDRAKDRLLIIETKWPVDAATLAESYKVDGPSIKASSRFDESVTALSLAIYGLTGRRGGAPLRPHPR